MTARLEVACITHRGPVRQRNEDSLAVGGWVAPRDMTSPVLLSFEGDGPCVIAVSDGLGGHKGGDVASAHVVRRTSDEGDLLRREATATELMSRIHSELEAASAANPEVTGMGATLVALRVDGETCTLVNLGDSKAFVLQGSYLVQQTEDDNPTSSGPERSHLVTQCLGGGGSTAPLPHVTTVPLVDGNAFVLLCSDGLTDFADVASLEDCLGSDLLRTAQDMHDVAVRGGGGDNITLALVHVKATDKESE